jgi:hypothetical protein
MRVASLVRKPISHREGRGVEMPDSTEIRWERVAESISGEALLAADTYEKRIALVQKVVNEYVNRYNPRSYVVNEDSIYMAIEEAWYLQGMRDP